MSEPIIRRLKDGTEFVERRWPQAMTIDSKVPGKWVFADLETGDLWEWEGGAFVGASKRKAALLAEIAASKAATGRPRGQTSVPGGLIGSAGVQPGGTVFKKYVPDFGD